MDYEAWCNKIKKYLMDYGNELQVAEDGNEKEHADDGNAITATWDVCYIYGAITC